MRTKRHNLGFSMIEVLISVLLVAVIASATLTLHYNSFKLADRAGIQTQAYYLAREGVEKVKIVRVQTRDPAYITPADSKNNFFDDSGYNNATLYGFKDYTNVITNATFFGNIFTSDEKDMKKDLAGSKFLRFFTFKNFSSDPTDKTFMQVKVGVCYGSAAVSLSKCNSAMTSKKNYIETVTVIRNYNN